MTKQVAAYTFVLLVGLAAGQVLVPDSLQALQASVAAGGNASAAGGNGTNATAEESNPIAEAGVSEPQASFPYHIEVKTIHYLLDQISGKIKSQHDKIMDQHTKNQNRVKDAARAKVGAAQAVLDAADKKDKAKLELLRAARAKLEEAKAVEAKANVTRTKSAAEVSGATKNLDAVKKDSEAEVKEATKSNEEQVNEALEILGNEMKLVQTVRFMLAELNKGKNAPMKKPSLAAVEKKMLAQQIDVVADDAAAAAGAGANGTVTALPSASGNQPIGKLR